MRTFIRKSLAFSLLLVSGFVVGCGGDNAPGPTTTEESANKMLGDQQSMMKSVPNEIPQEKPGATAPEKKE
jgi:hypothetical protein